MKKNLSIVALAYLIGVVVLFFTYLFNIINQTLTFSLLLSLAIPLISFLIYVFLFQFSIGKGNKTFLMATLGGIGIRLILMLIAVFLVLFYLKVDRYGFIFGLLFWYVFLLIMEILMAKDGFGKR